jgi:uncharacterized protein with GYD domain
LEIKLFFVALVKMKGKMTPAIIEAMQKACKSPPPGIKYHSVFCTLGQYDFVITFEAPDEKEAMKWAMPWAEFCDTQTMAAVSYEEAMKLLK